MEKLQSEKNSMQIVNRALFRFLIYGAIGTIGEVGFYTVLKIGRTLPPFLSWIFSYHWLVDPRLGLNQMWEVPIRTLYGQASLWMYLVYGAVCLFGLERSYRHIRHWPVLVRALLYGLVILVMECALGWVLRALVGYDIWYYDDGPLTIFRYTSFAVLPMWCIVGLFSENFFHIIDKLTRVKNELALRDVS
ncbi:MAG: hypothetical protein JXB03_13230 [Spirochaetales bacterium]|nr:hypothetical protein [Spirochaetales bacterium]